MNKRLQRWDNTCFVTGDTNGDVILNASEEFYSVDVKTNIKVTAEQHNLRYQRRRIGVILSVSEKSTAVKVTFL